MNPKRTGPELLPAKQSRLSTLMPGMLAALIACAVAPQALADGHDDERSNFVVSPYVGLGIDSFAAGDVNRYLNQDESGDIKERFTAGIEFSYRLSGDSRKPEESQVWVYGRTTHGVRSTDVDCAASPDLPLCEPFSLQPQNPTERSLFILRNASSLEGIVGLRWEFRALQVGSADNHSARAYVAGQLGFVSVSDGPDDAADVHHLAVGATITEGRYQHSFLEFGYGTNDLFLENSDRRFKVNARVVRELDENSRFGLFAHIGVDVDADDGSDSIQTFLGVYYKIGSDQSSD